jgi:hypothetical protein
VLSHIKPLCQILAGALKFTRWGNLDDPAKIAANYCELT